ncbi:hypothetical protein QBC33DRAFT_231648 [Phialemonium atrogriseum]|uniref:Uncharacterized protein n=1 Tax=Phialemonium atrogriseum TaxID=1093897 RepID=A0AAJ0FJZ4_9PEZI|nr:uncharacterized protein QBC33DRAFT_231648 [Phialemonium atrogriseum]KAK1771101.1 hypothetical protein QBC33DRAFT_231648 [Phialemonium atrogriseum]
MSDPSAPWFRLIVVDACRLHVLRKFPTRSPPLYALVRVLFELGWREKEGTEKEGTEKEGTEKEGTEKEGTEKEGTEKEGTGAEGEGGRECEKVGAVRGRRA